MTLSRAHIVLKVLARDIIICIVLGLLFALLGVYDSDDMSLLPRIVFWTLMMCGGAVLFAVTEPIVFGSFLKDTHPAAQLIAVAVLISIPITIVLSGMNTQFTYDWPAKNWAGQFINVFTLSIVITVGRYALFQIANYMKVSVPVAETPQDAANLFLSRLPLKFRSAALYAVSSEGHYLRVHTDKGSDLILMRISDAIRELAAADGLQVHRSWWVARSGIEEVKRDKGRRLLVLKNGEVAPVSRTYLSALKSAKLDGASS
jgi:uncharacterized membrane protein